MSSDTGRQDISGEDGEDATLLPLFKIVVPTIDFVEHHCIQSVDEYLPRMFVLQSFSIPGESLVDIASSWSWTRGG